jgi:myo-inositol-1(or 4)-monophosphatase
VKNPLEFAVNLSRTVGHLLQDRYESGNIEAKIKADTSLVTEADLLADRLITQSIIDEFPQDTILSEEINSVLKNNGKAIWVIDPLDGTTNYTLGVQYWGISIARLTEGQPQSAVIYFPMINELYSAERDQGALLNGKHIHTKPPNRELPAAFFSCCSRTFRHYDIKIPYKPRIFGSAAYSFCAVARGIAVLGFEATPKIWDIAAGWLIVSEAGGAVETLDDQIAFPLTEDLDYSQKSFPTVIASAPNLLPMARSHIKPKRILS